MSTALINIYLNSHYIIYSLTTLSESPFANFPPIIIILLERTLQLSRRVEINLLCSVTGLCFLKEDCLVQ